MAGKGEKKGGDVVADKVAERIESVAFGRRNKV